MHEHAYLAQCDAEEARHRPRETERSVMLMLVALALGTFAIGSGEFGSNGIVQLFADDLGVSVPTATNAITAYALGVVIGSPALTIAAARLNRPPGVLTRSGGVAPDPQRRRSRGPLLRSRLRQGYGGPP